MGKRAYNPLIWKRPCVKMPITSSLMAPSVRLLVIGERSAISRQRVKRFAAWVASTHPELGNPEELDEAKLLELVDEFEGGVLGENSGLAESWRVGFIDHLFHRVSDFEPQG